MFAAVATAYAANGAALCTATQFERSPRRAMAAALSAARRLVASDPRLLRDVVRVEAEEA